jgi:hypothetical protein
VATGNLKYAWVPDVHGQPRVEVLREEVVKAGFEFRVIHPPPDVTAQCDGPIIVRVERLV